MIVIKLLFPLSILLLIFLTLRSISNEGEITVGNNEFMNGVSLVAPRNEFPENPFAPIVAIHADWVAIMPYAFIGENSVEVRFDREQQWWGEKSEGVVRTIQLAKEMNLKIMLKPHVWIRGQGWTGDFRLNNEKEWNEWEGSYEKYILHYAKIADAMEVEAFCVGLEFKHVVRERPDYFKSIIKKVQKSYDGLVTYAANWDNYQYVTFWDEVDFIGINAYFPLSNENTPELETLLNAWRTEKNNLMDLSREYHKPIVFTEFGYRSIDKSAGNQWELEHHRRFEGQPNFNTQELAYKAIFLSFWEEPWFGGGYLWKWYPEGLYEVNENNSDYTPQGKPVELIIKSWYKKR